MGSLTSGMTTEEIIEFAKTRIEIKWQWGVRLEENRITEVAEQIGVQLC